MILAIAQQTFLLPGLLSLAALGLSAYSSRLRNGFVLLLILCWVPLYAWIVNIPNLPPKQAGDWFWIFFMVAAFIPLLIDRQRIRYGAWVALCIISMLTIIWPVLSYDATFSTHALIWAEAAAFLLIVTICLSPYISNEDMKSPIFDDSIHSLVFNFAVGVITVISGSLLLGMLCLSFGSMHAFPALYELKHKCKKGYYTPVTRKVSIIISALFLLVGRFYADIPISVFVPLTLALVLPLITRKRHRSLLLLGVLLIAFTMMGVIEVTKSNEYY